MWLFWFLLCVGFGAQAAPNEAATSRNLSVVTWNVNGVKKFRHRPNEVSFIRSHDIVLLQETFARDDHDLLELQGFYSHHARALPRSGSRNVWGLSSYFKVETFADGFWTKSFSPVDWLLISRWKSRASTGVTVFNVYLPVHTSGISVNEVLVLQQTFSDLLSLYPGDIFLLGGDFNHDRFKGDVSATGIQK